MPIFSIKLSFTHIDFLRIEIRSNFTISYLFYSLIISFIITILLFNTQMILLSYALRIKERK